LIVTQRKEYYQEETKKRAKAKTPKGQLYAKKKQHIGPMVSFVFFTCLTLSVVLSYVAIHATMAKTAVEINQAKKQLANVQNENEQLQLQIMNLTSLDRIEQVARNNMGMVRPEEVQFVSLPNLNSSEKNMQQGSKENISSQSVLTRLDNIYKKINRNMGNAVAAEIGTF